MAAIIQTLALALTIVLGAVAGPRLAAQTEPKEPQPEPETAAVTVRLKDDRFRPPRITIPAGTTVAWVNEEDDATVEHNVIARDYRWASDNFLPGEAYEHTFDTPGVYRYFCDLHGGMVGRVIVE
jgi:plastocyanin